METTFSEDFWEVRGPRTRRDVEGFSFHSKDTDSNVRVIVK